MPHHLQPQLARELLVAAHVIVVMVRAPDGPRLHALALQRFADGSGLRCVDDGRVTAGGDDEVGVVVLETRDGDDAHGGPLSFWLRRSPPGLLLSVAAVQTVGRAGV